MKGWRKQFKYDPIEPLLQCGNEAIVYFLNRDILEKKVPPIKTLWELPSAQRILRKQQADGSWKYPGRRADARQDYEQLETYRQLGYLIEKYGFNKKHPAIVSVAEFFFSCQTDEGDFRGIYSTQYAQTYSGGIAELLIKAGYGSDKRIKKCLDWFLATRQDDGGWAAPIRSTNTKWQVAYQMDEPLQPAREKPSSHMITAMVLRAFAAHGTYRRKKEAREAGRLVLSRFYESDKYVDRRDKSYWFRFSFPFWYTDLLSSLDSLHFFGFTREEPNIEKALKWFIEQQKKDGTWKLKLIRGQDKDLHMWMGYVICRIFKYFQ